MQPVSWKATARRLARVLCAAALTMSGLLAAAEQQESPPPAFPAKLLEGTLPFDVSLLFQGDLRGNIGPCG